MPIYYPHIWYDKHMAIVALMVCIVSLQNTYTSKPHSYLLIPLFYSWESWHSRKVIAKATQLGYGTVTAWS